MKVPKGKSRAECEKLVMRFVSNLAWVEDQGLLVDGLGGGSLPAPMGHDKERGFSICEEFDLSYFPAPVSDKALLALALMREGRGLNRPAYAFLSFFRVLEVAVQSANARVAWIAANVATVKGFQVREALAELAKKGITDMANTCKNLAGVRWRTRTGRPSSTLTIRRKCAGCRPNFRS